MEVENIFCVIGGSYMANEVINQSDNRVVTFPASKTYDLVMEYNIHAHPIKNGYPMVVPKFLAVRKEYGKIERIFLIESTIDIFPEVIETRVNEFLEEGRENLISYHRNRVKAFGYDEKDCKYRYYMLKPLFDLEKEYSIPNASNHRYRELGDFLNISDSPTNLIIPANEKIYNHVEAFEEQGFIDWWQSGKNFNVGDIVYVYRSKPHQVIKYKTVAVKIDLKWSQRIDDERFWVKKEDYNEKKNDTNERYVRLLLINTIDNNILNLENLMNNGLSYQPISARSIPDELVTYIEKYMFDSDLGIKKQNSRVLFCNITYMKYYRGITADDRPHNGGDYVKKTGDAMEKYNFLPRNGKVFGFVETKHRAVDGVETPNKLKIEKIDKAATNQDYLDGVTVIFCARDDKETNIVGWYDNATVYRKITEYYFNDKKCLYNITANVEDAHLLSEKDRKFIIHRTKNKDEAGFGSANVWYADDKKSEEIRKSAIEYIDKLRQGLIDEINDEINEIEELYEDPNLSDTEKEVLSKARIGQGGFRSRLIDRDKKCLMCGIRNESLLRASHIKPWKDSSGKERLNPNNGLLLCAIHDVLFDKGLITFDENGRVMISELVSKEDRAILGLDENFILKMNEDTAKFMKWHTDKLLKESSRIVHEKFGAGTIIDEDKTTITVELISEEGETYKRLLPKDAFTRGTMKRCF